MSITFSSCFYIIKSKFDPSIYVGWMNNFLSIVNNFNLVIYTDENSIKYIDSRNNPKIKIIIVPLEKFYTYKYKDYWIQNHKKNDLLNDKSNWELNMLWSEKINFVKETIDKEYFITDFYGWCDIGYFRNRQDDTNTCNLTYWPDNNKINHLEKDKVIYACINNDDKYMNTMFQGINNKNEKGLPSVPIPPYQNTIAGGFFILHKGMIHWWFDMYYNKLELYFNNDYLVKDDQIIIADCVFSHLDKFKLYREFSPPFDNWFMFQRIFNVDTNENNQSKENNTIQKSSININSSNISSKKVSILMPIYNGIKFIDDSVPSILNQTYNEWELLIGINGHPENSEIYQIAKKYETEDGKVRIFDFYNIKGKSNTLNEMIQFCNYNYIALLDVDDIWHERKLEKQIPFMGNYDVIGSRCIWIGDRPGIVPKIPILDFSDYNFANVNPIINSSVLIRKELCFWRKEVDGIEDYDLWIRLRKQNKKFYNCSEILVKHRIHNQSAFNAKGNHDKVTPLLQFHGIKRDEYINL